MDPTAFASTPQSDRLPGDCSVFVILLKSGLADCGSIGLRFENFLKGKVHEQKKRKNINDGYMYVCVAEKCEMMDFYFVFFSTVVFIDNFPPSLEKNPKNDGFLCMYVCMYV